MHDERTSDVSLTFTFIATHSHIGTPHPLHPLQPARQEASYTYRAHTTSCALKYILLVHLLLVGN